MADPEARIWAEVQSYLRSHYPGLRRQWFEELELLGIDAGIARVRAQTSVHRDYLHRQCLDAFGEAIRAVTGRLLTVRFLGPEDDPEAPYDHGLSAFRGLPMPEAIVLNPDNSFEHFIVGPSNRMAHAAAMAVADQPGRSYNPLFIHGGVGLGKTHLLQAICLRLGDRHPGASIHYTSCDGFITQYFESVQAGQMAAFRDKFRGVDVLVIDDIHFLAKRGRSQEEFFHTYNSVMQSGRQIIVSSDAPPEVIPHLEERLISRFRQGMVAGIDPPDLETRVAILKGKARMRGIPLPDDAAFHVAACIDSNIRELEGAITSLQLAAGVDGVAVDLALARRVLGETPAARAESPTIHTVIAAVTEFYGVRLTDLQSKRRHRSVTMPRQVCMYLARTHTRHSLEEIGGHFGGRDHTTVMHAIRAVDSRRKSDPTFDQQVVSLDERLRHPIRPG
ncbi:MAG: chromosomal replication initiator protein DnaA [Phycisphaerae bacterium]|nr:chromosomal replication initiator protein DnaA [Phycisphaerae bacterium]